MLIRCTVNRSCVGQPGGGVPTAGYWDSGADVPAGGAIQHVIRENRNSRTQQKLMGH